MQPIEHCGAWELFSLFAIISPIMNIITVTVILINALVEVIYAYYLS